MRSQYKHSIVRDIDVIFKYLVACPWQISNERIESFWISFSEYFFSWVRSLIHLSMCECFISFFFDVSKYGKYPLSQNAFYLLFCFIFILVTFCVATTVLPFAIQILLLLLFPFGFASSSLSIAKYEVQYDASPILVKTLSWLCLGSNCFEWIFEESHNSRNED